MGTKSSPERSPNMQRTSRGMKDSLRHAKLPPKMPGQPRTIGGGLVGKQDSVVVAASKQHQLCASTAMRSAILYCWRRALARKLRAAFHCLQSTIVVAFPVQQIIGDHVGNRVGRSDVSSFVQERARVLCVLQHVCATRLTVAWYRWICATNVAGNEPYVGRAWTGGFDTAPSDAGFTFTDVPPRVNDRELSRAGSWFEQGQRDVRDIRIREFSSARRTSQLCGLVGRWRLSLLGPAFSSWRGKAVENWCGGVVAAVLDRARHASIRRIARFVNRACIGMSFAAWSRLSLEMLNRETFVLSALRRLESIKLGHVRKIFARAVHAWKSSFLRRRDVSSKLYHLATRFRRSLTGAAFAKWLRHHERLTAMHAWRRRVARMIARRCRERVFLAWVRLNRATCTELSGLHKRQRELAAVVGHAIQRAKFHTFASWARAIASVKRRVVLRRTTLLAAARSLDARLRARGFAGWRSRVLLRRAAKNLALQKVRSAVAAIKLRLTLLAWTAWLRHAHRYQTMGFEFKAAAWQTRASLGRVHKIVRRQYARTIGRAFGVWCAATCAIALQISLRAAEINARRRAVSAAIYRRLLHMLFHGWIAMRVNAECKRAVEVTTKARARLHYQHANDTVMFSNLRWLRSLVVSALCRSLTRSKLQAFQRWSRWVYMGSALRAAASWSAWVYEVRHDILRRRCARDSAFLRETTRVAKQRVLVQAWTFCLRHTIRARTMVAWARWMSAMAMETTRQARPRELILVPREQASRATERDVSLRYQKQRAIGRLFAWVMQRACEPRLKAWHATTIRLECSPVSATTTESHLGDSPIKKAPSRRVIIANSGVLSVRGWKLSRLSPTAIHGAAA